MHHKTKKFILPVTIFIFIVFTGLGIYNAGFVKENLSCVSARYDTASVSPVALKKAMNKLTDSDKTTLPKITLWNRLKKETIQNPTNHLTIDTNVIQVSGDISLIIPMKLISGNYVYENDDKGCVLDTKTAFKLFGTTQAVNDQVVWNGKTYVVRGVVKAEDTILMLQINNNNYLFSNIEALYQNNIKKNIADNDALHMKNLLIQTGYKEPDAIIDGVQVSWLLHFLCQLPLLLLGIITAVLFLRCFLHSHQSLISRVLYGLTFLIIVMFLITNFTIHIPSQFIPTKWSDYNFYVDKYKEIKETRVNISNCRLMPKDLLQQNLVRKSLLYSLINIASLIAMGVLMKNNKKIS